MMDLTFKVLIFVVLFNEQQCCHTHQSKQMAVGKMSLFLMSKLHKAHGGKVKWEYCNATDSLRDT
uniref:Uncharacterized protein n=1 Tax=Anguilla anguilla TaxID=7936 RepID=A0A0E9WJE4_ANGAN